MLPTYHCVLYVAGHYCWPIWCSRMGDGHTEHGPQASESLADLPRGELVWSGHRLEGKPWVQTVVSALSQNSSQCFASSPPYRLRATFFVFISDFLPDDQCSLPGDELFVLFVCLFLQALLIIHNLGSNLENDLVIKSKHSFRDSK